MNGEVLCPGESLWSQLAAYSLHNKKEFTHIEQQGSSYMLHDDGTIITKREKKLSRHDD